MEILETRRLLTGIWTQGANLPTARGDGAAVSTYAGIELFGGTAGSSVLLLDPSNNFAARTQTSLGQNRTGLGVEQTITVGPGNPGTDVQLNTYASDVFVYGGSTGGAPTSSVVNYVNQTGDAESTSGPSMSIPRSYFSHAVDLATGDLYAIGGITTGNTTVASAERYDPRADSWSAIAPLPVALSQAAGATDGAGHLFVFGGKTAAGTPVNTVYRYTIATDTWDAAAAMPVAVADATAVYGAYGTIYVAGGKSASGAVANFSVYNPIYNSWTAEPALPKAVYGAAGVIDTNDDLDLIGGFNASGSAVATIESTPNSFVTPNLPQPPTLSVPDVWAYYSGLPQAVSPTAVGADGVTPVDGTFAVTYDGSSTAPTDAGTYAAVVRFTSADPGYVDGAADATVTIAPVAPTVTVTGGGTFTYDAQPHAITATALGVDGSTPVAGSFAYTYDGAATAPTTWGAYTAVATFTPSDPNYTTATASTTITIPDPRVVTGVTVTGLSTTSLRVDWSPVTLPTGATPTYTVIERTWHNGVHDPKGSGGTPGYYVYTPVGSGLTGTSLTITGLATAGPITGSHTYLVVSVDDSTSPATVSDYSAVATGSPLFAPSLGGMLEGGAYVSWATVEIGDSVRVGPVFYGNESPVFSLVGAPASMSVNPATGVITYSPVRGESGSVAITEVATNSLGTASIPFSFNILQRPGIVITGGTFAFDGNTHAATAVAYDNDGNPIAGTFAFTYSPVQYPTVDSTAPYAEPGTYDVHATFTSGTTGYGGATATLPDAITITSVATTLTVPPSVFLADGVPHASTAAAFGPDGVTAVPGTTGFTYDGSTTLPTEPGTYAVAATFTSSSWEYGDATATGTLTILSAASTQPLALSASYIQLDPDGTTLDVWTDTTAAGPMAERVGVRAYNSLSVTATSLTVDLTNGATLPTGGITFMTGDSLLVLGPAGTNTVATDSTGIAVGDATVHFTNVGDVLFNPGAGVDTLTVTGGNLHLAAGTSYTQTVDAFSSISIGAGAMLVVDNAAVYYQRVVIDTQTVAIAATGTLDLGSNDMVVEAGDVATLTIQIADGRLVGDSSSLTGLGVMPDTLDGVQVYTSFDTVAPSPSAVLLKHTFLGDLNLDGVADGSDYSRIDSSAGATG